MQPGEGMKALLLFHFRAGIRLAMQSFTPVFSAALAIIMLNIDPSLAVKGIALDIFSDRRSSNTTLSGVSVLAFLFAFSAAGRLAHGANAWVRHLPFTDRANRRALAAALIAVQLPLIIAIGLLGFVAHFSGALVFRPVLLRLVLVLLAAALTATPVIRHWASASLSLVAAGVALYGALSLLIPAASLLVVADAVGGRMRAVKPPRMWKPATTMFNCRVAWRALGWRLIFAYLVSLVPLGIALLFTANNEPPPALSSGAARLGGCVAVLLFLAGFAAQLAVRRPVWPWARSLPWSVARRVLSDGLFMASLAIPLMLLTALLDARAALAVLAVAPFLALRAAAYMRRVADRRSGVGGFIVEGVITGALVCLLPWTAWVFLAAAPPALRAAIDAECLRQKATRWSERHHAAAGDPLSWSAS